MLPQAQQAALYKPIWVEPSLPGCLARHCDERSKLRSTGIAALW